MGRCPSCGAVLRRCCESVVGQAHWRNCPNSTPKRPKFLGVSRETPENAVKARLERYAGPQV